MEMDTPCTRTTVWISLCATGPARPFAGIRAFRAPPAGSADQTVPYAPYTQAHQHETPAGPSTTSPHDAAAPPQLPPKTVLRSAVESVPATFATPNCSPILPAPVPPKPPAPTPTWSDDARREEQRTRIQKNAKLEASVFHGSRNPADFTEWLSALESYFKLQRMDDDMRVEFAETMLGGPAKIFWENCLEAAAQRDDPPYTWATMTDVLRKKYVPRLYATQSLMDWLDLTQGKRTVSMSRSLSCTACGARSSITLGYSSPCSPEAYPKTPVPRF